MTLIQIVNMNERILELMKQADYPAPELALRAHKLAELIVKECADFIDSHKRVDEYGLACDIVYGVDLMKHFGVKE